MTEPQDKKSKTFQDYLVEATEIEFFTPKLDEQHQRAIELLEKLEITAYRNSQASNYYDRKESALKHIAWKVGLSEMKVYPILVTKVFKLANLLPPLAFIGNTALLFSDPTQDYRNKVEYNVKTLGISDFKKADPLTRILESAFNRFKHICYSYIQYYESDASTRFVRVYLLSERVSIPKSGEENIILSYLKFYKNGYPKPHGTGKDVVSL